MLIFAGLRYAGNTKDKGEFAVDTIKIGKYIAAKRKALGLTQVQVAGKLGMSDKSVSKWERGVCLPDVSVYMDLCEILGISLNEFLAGEDIEQDKIARKSEENLIEVTKDGKERKRRLKTVIAALAAFCVVVTGILVYRSVFDGKSEINYIEPLAKDSAEMAIAELLSDADGAFLYDYAVDKGFGEMRVSLSVYRKGELERKEIIGAVGLPDSEEVKEGMIAVVPEFDNGKVKLIAAGGGLKYSLNFDILDDVSDRQLFGRGATQIDGRTGIVNEEEQVILALIYGKNGISEVSVSEIGEGEVQSRNDYVYALSVCFGG